MDEQHDAHVARYWQTRFLRQVRRAIPKDKPARPASEQPAQEEAAHVA